MERSLIIYIYIYFEGVVTHTSDAHECVKIWKGEEVFWGRSGVVLVET